MTGLVAVVKPGATATAVAISGKAVAVGNFFRRYPGIFEAGGKSCRIWRIRTKDKALFRAKSDEGRRHDTVCTRNFDRNQETICKIRLKINRNTNDR